MPKLQPKLLNSQRCLLCVILILLASCISSSDQTTFVVDKPGIFLNTSYCGDFWIAPGVALMGDQAKMICKGLKHKSHFFAHYYYKSDRIFEIQT